MDLLAQELANARYGVPVINEPIINEHNEPIPTHEPPIQEGNNNFESYQGPPPLKRQKVRKNDEPKNKCKY